MNKTTLKYAIAVLAGVVLADQIRSLPVVGKVIPKV